MKWWVKRVSALGLIVGVLVAILGFWSYRQSRLVPEFYQLAQQQPIENAQAVSQELVEQMERLQADVQRAGSWHAQFSDAQINAWLSTSLSEEYPLLLPPGTEDPRVKIQDGKLLAAARYKEGHIDTVISFELSVELTEQPNVLALRLQNLRAGALRLPIANFAHGISSEAAKNEIEVLWDKNSLQSRPVALVTIPSEHKNYVNTPVIIESIRLDDGMLSMTGRTGPGAVQSFQPRGPLTHMARLELVGYRVGNSLRRSDHAPALRSSKTQ